MTSRFPNFLNLQLHRPKTESKGKAQSKPTTPASYFSSPGLSVNPCAGTSKNRNAKQGTSKIPAKTTVAKSPSYASGYTKRYISTLEGSKQYNLGKSTGVLDELSKALILKKKKSCSSRSSPPTPTYDKNTSKTAKRSTSTNLGFKKSGHRSVDGNRKASKENVVIIRKATFEEGPLEFPDENYDFYSILSKSKPLKLREDEEDIKEVIGNSQEKIKRRKGRHNSAPRIEPYRTFETPSAKSSSNLKATESEIWGDMRTSTAESSMPSSPPTPSLTSVSDEKNDSNRDGVIQRDENNNILENIKSTLYKSLSFLNPSRLSGAASIATTVISNESRSSVGGTERKEALVVDYYDEGNRHDSDSTSNHLDRVESAEEDKNTEEESCDYNNNNFNDSSRPNTIITAQDSPAIPFEIKTSNSSHSSQSCNESQRDHCTRQLKNCLAQSYQAKLERSEMHMVAIRESQSLDEPPSLTMMPEPYPDLLKANSLLSMQLVLGGLGELSAEMRPSHFRDMDTQNSLTNCISASTSYTSVSADEEFFNADATENSEETFETQQTQTQRVASQDAATGTETLEEKRKREKLMSLAVRVNAGVDIHVPLNHKRKSVKLRGIMKTSRREGETTTTDSDSYHFVSTIPEEVHGRRTIPEKINYPKTFTQVGADYGFPADISLSGIIKNLATMTWEPTSKGAAKTENVHEKDDGNNTSAYAEGSEGDSESNHLIKTAYDVFHAGLRVASDLIGVEGDTEGREDRIRYNGYRIKVRGKNLLLESLHVNCDFNNIESNGTRCRSNHSAMCLSRPTMSRAELEQGCEGRRIRIVIRIAGPLAQQDVLETASLLQHYVLHSEGKWTLIYGNGEHRDDFIEIGCPTGVHPESLAYDLLNGFILVDAP